MMKKDEEMSIDITYIDRDFSISELGSALWTRSPELMVESYWSGRVAPAERHFSVRLLWSVDSLYTRFEAKQGEALVINLSPETGRKTLGLWDRDVCEIFVAPDASDRDHYYEFEIAPTGEWVDLEIFWTPNGRETNVDYVSGMESSALVDGTTVISTIKIPWAAFGDTPRTGDVWFGNLYRCVGSGPERGYLSWKATETPEPNFHVPSKFGMFRFVK